MFVACTHVLHSLTGMPSIFDFMTVLCFFMAERTASSKNPGHLSSFRISLRKDREMCVYIEKGCCADIKVRMRHKCICLTFGNMQAPLSPERDWPSTRSSQKAFPVLPSW